MCGFIVPSRAVELETPHSAAAVVARPRPASAGRLGQGADPGTTSPLPANVGCGERMWRSCCWCHRGLPPPPQPDPDAIDRSGATRVMLLAALTLVHCVALGLLVASSTDLLQYSTLISLCVFSFCLSPISCVVRLDYLASQLRALAQIRRLWGALVRSGRVVYDSTGHLWIRWPNSYRAQSVRTFCINFLF
jgi:hypothetical protein